MLSPWLYGIGAFYSALGLVILRLARKPSCRVCLLRSRCPNRLRGLAATAHLPQCMRTEQALSVRPL
jgi:hypothetical protein